MTGTRRTNITGQDWVRGMERRVLSLERRPAPATASDLLGPGLAGLAVRISDWNDDVTLFNGIYYSGPEALHAPLDNKWYIGQVLADPDGYGYMRVVEYRISGSGGVYVRAFATPVGATRTYEAWELIE